MAKHPNYLSVLIRTFAGRADQVAVAVVASSAIALLLKLVTGTPVTLRGAVIGLIGNAVVIVLALWLKKRYAR